MHLAHHLSGRPYLNSIIYRGKGEKIQDFPIGFHCQIKDLKLEKMRSIDTGFYIPYLRFDHFGHYLTETTSSLSYLLFLKKIGIISRTSIPIIMDSLEHSDRLAKILGVNHKRFICKSHEQPIKQNLSSRHRQQLLIEEALPNSS